MSQVTSPHLSGHEPSLGGDGEQLSGLEPLLGGARRAEADLTRIYTLIDTDDAAERQEIIGFARRLGQTLLYARELIQIIPPHARQKVGNWRGSFTLTQRRRAIDALGELGGAESLGPLLAAMTDATYDIRTAAERALNTICTRLDLKELKQKKVLAALVEMLGSPSLPARKMAAKIVASAPPDVVLGALIADGLTAEEWAARRESAWVLGKLGDRRATARLVAILDDPAAAVRRMAAWALGRLDAPVATPYLVRKLTDRDESVRGSVVEALGAQIGRMSALDGEFKTLIDLLVRVVEKDREMSVRHAALDALAAIDAPEARAALAAILNR